ncbi:3-isopropylmalate dehydratase small subunit [Advenella sp. FME57]|uniref:3-isopropylmalate dehydratase small subunit n=1 Tax=Advenella sp. FME57 TaxID=2742604 RepID=UPI001867740C|nr:3-isopropylmalate dehydratase small subunit [Advenella sp. FME57]
MDAFKTLSSNVVPLDRANVDTDAILPKQFLKSIQRSGFGDYLFDEWRYLDRGEPGQRTEDRQKNQNFCLNKQQYAGAKILLTRENFGCGSSREHAVWALHDFGIRVLIAPSFADIFYGNCFKNGVLPIVVNPTIVDSLFCEYELSAQLALYISLEDQLITANGETVFQFDIDASRKHRLLNGLDDIDITFQFSEKIRKFEAAQRAREPWFFR